MTTYNVVSSETGRHHIKANSHEEAAEIYAQASSPAFSGAYDEVTISDGKTTKTFHIGSMPALKERHGIAGTDNAITIPRETATIFDPAWEELTQLLDDLAIYWDVRLFSDDTYYYVTDSSIVVLKTENLFVAQDKAKEIGERYQT